MHEYALRATQEDAGKRLDLFLINFFREKGFSRTVIQKIINEGKVTSAGGIIDKPHYKIKSDEEIKVIIEDRKPNTLDPENIPLEVVYEDDDLAIVNKPAGLVVHPAPGNTSHTLVNALLYSFKELSSVNPERPGIVHRLDKDTSGLLVIAKNNFAHLHLSRQFAQHEIKRKYIALVKGRVEFDEDVIEVPIGRHPTNREKMSVRFSKKTRYAKTHYRTIKRWDAASLLELEPFTGRTHQLRVHLAFLGHPILGDTKYGRDNPFSRLALHAQYLGFAHPATGKFVEFSCPPPPEFIIYIRTVLT